jgi:predicted site-specific integrase-resolvase
VAQAAGKEAEAEVVGGHVAAISSVFAPLYSMRRHTKEMMVIVSWWEKRWFIQRKEDAKIG